MDKSKIIDSKAIPRYQSRDLDMNFQEMNFPISCFKKKKFPKCGGKMTKNKCAETVDGVKVNTVFVPLCFRC